MQRVSIWVVVPYFAGHLYLEHLCASLRASTRRPSGIVFVDNGPAGARLSGRAEFECVRAAGALVVESATGIGFGRACNLGAVISAERGASHLVLLNQDAYVDPHMLELLLEEQLRTLAAVVGPIQVQPQTGEMSLFYARNYFPGALDETGRLLDERKWPVKSFEVGMLSGACLLAPVSVLTEHGLFDPLFTLYGEDNDLAERVRSAGLASRLVPRARLYHVHSHASGDLDSTGGSQIRCWVMEAGSVRLLRDRWPALPLAVGHQAVRRGFHYVREALLRSPREWPLLLRSDARMWARRWEFVRARRGESVRERMARWVALDRADSVMRA